MGTRVQSFRELDVYKVVFSVQQEIFQLSKHWPPEEKYALTDQIRRRSRSIGANIAEVWAKRRYVAHLLGKCTDADGEVQETEHWLTTAWACAYITKDHYEALLNRLLLLGRKLGSVIQKHESFRAD